MGGRRRIAGKLIKTTARAQIEGQGRKTPKGAGQCGATRIKKKELGKWRGKWRTAQLGGDIGLARGGGCVGADAGLVRGGGATLERERG